MSLYILLGVARTASKQEIKVAYRKLALQFHPDKHAQSAPQARAAAAAKFRQLSSAYETLIDDRKRAAYDRNADSASEEACRQPKPRDSSSNSAQSHYSNSNGSGGGGRYPNSSQYRQSYPDRRSRMKAIRNVALQKLVKFGLEFSVWLLKETVRILIEVFIRILIEAFIEALKQKKVRNVNVTLACSSVSITPVYKDERSKYESRSCFF